MTWQRWKGIMKCYPFEERRLAKWEPPYIVQPKYDGVRCKAIPLPNGSYLLLSSEENPIFSVPHINEAVKEQNVSAYELDGELYRHGWSFEQILSVTSRTKNIHPDYTKMHYHVFDCIDNRPQTARTINIDAMHLEIPLISTPYWLCRTLEEIKGVYDELISIGYEGIVVRHWIAPYTKKRSIWVMKFKPKKKDTYKIVGWKEEISKDGVPKGRIGSLVLTSQAGDNFAVSAGLNDKERAELWEEREELPGLSAIVHYQHLTNKKIPKGSFDLEVIR